MNARDALRSARVIVTVSKKPILNQRITPKLAFEFRLSFFIISESNLWMPWEQSELGGERAVRRRRRRRRRTRAEAQDKKAQGYNAPQSAFYFLFFVALSLLYWLPFSLKEKVKEEAVVLVRIERERKREETFYFLFQLCVFHHRNPRPLNIIIFF